MIIQFKVLSREQSEPREGENAAYLHYDRWNDFGFVTQFVLNLYDSHGTYHEIGAIKIGFEGQNEEATTLKKLPHQFESLDSVFFSLGQSADFYKNIHKLGEYGQQLLVSLNDLVKSPNKIDGLLNEDVFKVSLLREVSLTAIKGQFFRVLNGGAELTDYKFKFARPEIQNLGKLELSFEVKVDSTPNTNIHAIIGRNGVGKTTLLNGMINAVVKPSREAMFFDLSVFSLLGDREIDNDYFSSLVSVSFSALDTFTPPEEQPDPTKGTCYFYIGLKEPNSEGLHRSIDALHSDCIDALKRCFNNKSRAKLWREAIDKLGFDENFASMSLHWLENTFDEIKAQQIYEFDYEYRARVLPFLQKMSSGHSIVLLTVTRLVATVEEKTLVLLDEPESHLHPPLLSAFIRALSELLLQQNGLAIIATHSPVVLQEIPKSCVWKVFRQGRSISSDRPKIETFAENVGILTDEVFGLELAHSGFHDLLRRSVSKGGSYQEILHKFGGSIGFEGRALLKTMIVNRDKGHSHDEVE